MKVKICGITTIEDALAACEAGADALGFNVALEAKKKNRYIDPEKAASIIDALPPFISTVAVTVNETTDRLKEYLEFVDFVQLHGEESAEQCAQVGKRVIKAFRMTPDFSNEAFRGYSVAAYLLDAYMDGERGGTGTTCDWSRAAELAREASPMILAGGLTPANVHEAAQAVRPYGVDTAGGVESAPGKKDHEKMREFVRNAKAPLS